MIKNLFKQIWNSRRSNGWIFTELLVIFIATWFVVDPLYTLIYQTKLIPLGCDPTNVVCLKVGVIPENEDDWREEFSGQDQVLQNFETMMELVKGYKGVASVTPVSDYFIWSGSSSYTSYRNTVDTARVVNVKVFECFTGSGFFDVFRFKNAATDSWMDLDSIPYIPNGVFITQNTEEVLFGRGKGLGREFATEWQSKNRSKIFKVVGVLENFVGDPGFQPFPCVIHQQPPYTYCNDNGDGLVSSLTQDMVFIIFRLAEGVDKNRFMEEFQNNQLPKLSIGNLYVSQMIPLEKLYASALADYDIPTDMTLKGTLTTFFMLNVCLAVFATFWLRIKKRRSEIGLMMSMGATRASVRNYFMAESLLIFGIAAFVGILILVQVLFFKGFYVAESFYNAKTMTSSFGTGWPINNYFARFVIITLIVLVIEGATVLFGTWFSARRAAQILPADALC